MEGNIGNIISSQVITSQIAGHAAFNLPSAEPVKHEVQAVAPVASDTGKSLDKGNNDTTSSLEVIKAAAQAFNYPLGDKKFTIYKDSRTGEYITRFTSLIDGSVTYYPPPQLLKLSAGSAEGRTTGTVFEIEA